MKVSKSIFLFVLIFTMNLYTITFAESGELEDVCTHEVYSTDEISQYHYGYCDKCQECNSRTAHYVYRYKNTGNANTHSAYCSCGRYMGAYWHNYRAFEKYSKSEHIGTCPCGYSAYLYHVDDFISISKGEIIDGVLYSSNEQLDKYHKVVCKDCGEFLRIEEHKWSGGDTSPHKCSKCSYIHSKQYDATKGRHYFDIANISSIGSVDKCEICNEYLVLEYEENTLLTKLPAKEKYTMVGNPKPMQEKSVDDDQYIKTNFMPINVNGEIIPLNKNSLIVRSYIHGNYFTHYSKLTEQAIEKIADNLKYSENEELLSYITKRLKKLGTLGGYNQGKKEDIIEEIVETVSGDTSLSVVDATSIINVVSQMGDFAIKAIKTPLLEWFKEDLEIKDTWLKGGETTLENKFTGDFFVSKDRKYTIYFSKLDPGKYEILRSKLLTDEIKFDIYSYTAEGFSELLYCTLFNKGDDSESEDEPCDILAYITVGYRDEHGNSIFNKDGNLATPTDAVISNIVYSGTSERLVTSDISAQMDWTQSAGYRYKGYLIKYGDDKSGYYGLYNSPSEMVVTPISTVSVTSSFTTQGLGISIVFYYEPVEIIALQHRADGELIKTNKNLDKMLMPTNTNYDALEDVYAPKKFESLNKNFWPGYILNSYSIYKNSIAKENLIAQKVYDVDTTTKINSKDDSKRYAMIYTAMISDLASEYDKFISEKLGYGSDKIIVFEYLYPKVEIKNLNYTNNSILKDINKQQLTYTIKLDGDNMLVKSLDTTKLRNNEYKTLEIKMANGNRKTFKYDASNYALVQAFIYTKDLNKNTKTLYKVVVGDESLLPKNVEKGKVQIVDNFYSFAEGYILNTEELLSAINSVWADLYIEFKYYEGGNVIDVLYLDEENNVLMPPEQYKFIANLKEITIPVIELDGYKLIKYELDKKENMSVKNLKNVTVVDNGLNRKLVFVYKIKNNVPEIPEEKPTYPYAVIKSNDKENEEYDVESAIPTSEDLYANVVTDSYIIENVTSIIKETQNVSVRLKKRYYTSVDDDENQVTSNIAITTSDEQLNFCLEYSYYGGENNKLFIIENAIIENEAVIDRKHYTENGKVLIEADYHDNEPSVNFVKGGKLQIQNNLECVLVDEKDGTYYLEIMLDGIDYIKPDLNALVKTYQSDHVALDRIIRKNSLVNGDYLSVIYGEEEIVYLDGLEKMMSADRLLNITELISSGYYINTAKAPLTNSNVLYEDRKIYTCENAENKLHETTKATVNYIINNQTGETRNKTYTKNNIYMNDINIYTPIINTSMLIPINNDNRSDNQLIVNDKENVLTLDSVFKISIPNSGEHIYAVKNQIPYKGYGTKLYNYKGNYLADENEYSSKGLKTLAFAKEKLVKFSFDVYALKYNKNEIIENKLILANTWYDVGSFGTMGLEDYKFIIPAWVKDNEAGNISVRIVSENIPKEYDSKTDNMESYIAYDIANEKDIYILQKDFDVYIAGSIYDLQIRDSDDFGWNGKLIDALKILNTSDIKNLYLPIGQFNQNMFSGYKYGLKLGYRFYFDLKTKGVASDEVLIEPEFYYISEDASIVTKDISIFYDSLEEKLVKFSDVNDVDIKMALTSTRGNVNNKNFIFELVRGSIINEDKVYKVAAKIGTVFDGLILKEIDSKLPYDNVLELATLYGYGTNTNKFISDAKKSKIIDDENDIRNSSGHWYGEYYLPSTTRVALGDVSREAVLKGEKEVIKNGYLIVVFKKIKTLSDSNEYLTYSNPDGDSRWEKEGAKYNSYEINLPDGKVAVIPEFEEGIAMAIYDLSLRANDDYNSEGTH